ncbi:MAG: hypothetical protein HYY30_06735 [Chloroflexi bacterium]|nr:hypothetical protein [Chloroflexota bacterium]
MRPLPYAARNIVARISHFWYILDRGEMKGSICRTCQAGMISDKSNTPVAFAHDSEREFASILDFYQIEWMYEPRSFPLRWDSDGRIAECFTPDFYLPQLDLYIELTTLKQSLVTRKNRKLRHLRELYPEINIKLLYGRDFRSLMVKYGLTTKQENKQEEKALGHDSKARSLVRS